MLTRSLLSFASLAVLVASLGCESRITGNEGNFEFSYAADDRVTDFNKPVAVGARLDIAVKDVGDRAAVELSAATTDDEAVMSVVTFAAGELTVEGIADGEVLLEVTGTTADGEELSDSVNLLVRVPEVLKLRHTCTADNAAVYLTGQRIVIGYDMEKANGQPVIGYGLNPVTSSDAAALALVASASNQVVMAFDTGDASATATLTSTIDTTTLEAQIATKGEITDVEEPTGYVVEDIDVGEKYSFYVRPMVGDRTVCQGNTLKTVTSDTPDICTVTDRDAEAESGDESYEFGWFEVEGVAAGECLYTVTFTEGNAGAGASKQFSYTIEP